MVMHDHGHQWTRHRQLLYSEYSIGRIRYSQIFKISPIIPKIEKYLKLVFKISPIIPKPACIY